MTEKRFVDIEVGADIGQIRLYTTDKDYETYGSDDVLKLINRLSEENEQLKSELENCRECLELNRESCARHMKENEELKSENLILKGKLHQLRLKCGKQEEEIECLSEETIEKFKQDLQDGNFIEFTAR